MNVSSYIGVKVRNIKLVTCQSLFLGNKGCCAKVKEKSVKVIKWKYFRKNMAKTMIISFNIFTTFNINGY